MCLIGRPRRTDAEQRTTTARIDLLAATLNADRDSPVTPRSRSHDAAETSPYTPLRTPPSSKPPRLGAPTRFAPVRPTFALHVSDMKWPVYSAARDGRADRASGDTGRYIPCRAGERVDQTSTDAPKNKATNRTRKNNDLLRYAPTGLAPPARRGANGGVPHRGHFNAPTRESAPTRDGVDRHR
jgi:hypothetical protein